MQRKQTKIVSTQKIVIAIKIVITRKFVITIKIVIVRKFVITMTIEIAIAIVKKVKTTQTQTMLEINDQSFNRHSIIGVYQHLVEVLCQFVVPSMVQLKTVPPSHMMHNRMTDSYNEHDVPTCHEMTPVTVAGTNHCVVV